MSIEAVTWAVAEQVVRTTREGMHNLRAMLTGLQTVAKSVGSSLYQGGS